ncbi:Phosphotransferase enzyme family protein [Roseovarius sp. THAF8]|uniref:phosphotransferase family protein n=1 Tax=Roseovarius sp. THAF8 TaxID=2587846 RepID=UPI0012697DFC|nr:aminoglycoside phosphotransferase family protein [Roseovarius sp. THAF8]QFT97808.1 Phosphotransferase enzyme family protein [Roseovarius sp. THAF8]
MANLLNYNHRRINGYVKEFVAQQHPAQDYNFACIYRSADYPKERQVFVVEIGERRYALKVDTKSAKTERLVREFETLRELHAHFEKFEKLDVVTPVYMSPSGEFFVTGYIDNRTATEAIYEQEADNRARQIYRKAGHWLHALHGFEPITTENFWYDWMLETLATLTGSRDCPHATPEQYGPMIDQMHRDVRRIEGAEDTHVFSHGDFHGRNLILGAGVTYGFDFTEVTRKLAVYDIVDFLKTDVFRPASPDEIDRSGLIAKNKAMFFKLYRHPINMDVLDFCMRARLLIDWLSITTERHDRTQFQQKKFDHLHSRLLLAFEHPL